MDTLYRNSDSLIYTINGLRRALKDSTGGGAALSDLTDATDTNTITNIGQQEWKWNGLSASTGLKLSSTGVGVVNSTQKLFECTMSGVLPASGSSSYAGYFNNLQTVGGGVGLYAQGVTRSITAVGSIYCLEGFYSGTANFRTFSGNTYVNAATSESLVMTSGTRRFLFSNPNVASIYASINNIATGNQALIFNGDYLSAFYNESTSIALIERNLGKLIFSANTGLVAGAGFTNRHLPALLP